MPDTVLRVSESGIFRREDMELLQGAGFRAFLVGESLMRSADPTSALRSLSQAR
jgi:indole-3-glycerol phosphate synthase